MGGKPHFKPVSNNLLQSFICAFAGLLHALRHERNLRIDFSVAAFVLYFSRYYHLERAEKALLFLMIGFVISCELINTAIENTVDLETSSYHSLARTAKDVAAAAVFISAAASALAGYFLFWDPAVLNDIRSDICSNFLPWLFLLGASIAFIFLPGARRR